MKLLREEVKSHRKPVLLASFLFSLILNVGLRLLSQNRILSLVLIIFVFYFFIQHIYQFIQTRKFELVLGWSKTNFLIVLFDFTLILLSLILILILERIPFVRKLISFLVFFFFTIFSFLMHTFAYYLNKDDVSNFKAIRYSLLSLWTYRRKMVYLFLDYFKVAIQWTLIAILFNVLVYSQKIPSILELSEAESAKRLLELFNSPLSRLIQNMMVSLAMFYMFYLGAFYVYVWLSKSN